MFPHPLPEPTSTPKKKHHRIVWTFYDKEHIYPISCIIGSKDIIGLDIKDRVIQTNANSQSIVAACAQVGALLDQIFPCHANADPLLFGESHVCVEPDHVGVVCSVRAYRST